MYLPLSDNGPDDIPLILEVIKHGGQHLSLGITLCTSVFQRSAETHRAVVLRMPCRLLVLEVLQMSQNKM